MEPRLVRMRDAPKYLGMCKNVFNKVVRPYIPNIQVSKQGVAFDRLDLDRWVEQNKRRNRCPINERRALWDENVCQDSSNEEAHGMLIKGSSEEEFMKTLDLIRSKRRKNT
ncbi:MAG: hypothetical protein Q7V63_10255 [Gammaproteobacteria bacterium]|nr:hypothetical protein [Gammaproteobacteria bacterium]